MKYRITNQHSIPRSYETPNGQEVSFDSGETKTIQTKPPRRQGLWLIEAVEETEKPEDIETTAEGGEN